MASASQSPFSLRPWPTGDRKPKSLGEFIARVKSGPGGFRGINEEDLRKEVELENAGLATGSVDVDVDMDSDPEASDEPSAATVTIETIRSTREDVLRSIDIAHQNAMLTLDFVSLLLTKEDPTNAGRTLSPALRELVGIGTIGADKLAAPQTNASRIYDNKMVATGWKFLDINRSMDSVLSAAARLQKEIALEMRYWADVLAVSEKGWSVSRLPHERQTLGVKFGFSESAPEFRNNSLAPMRRSDDGTVNLDAARIAVPQRVRVSIERGGKIVGESALPRALPADAPLDSRVMEARNTIFHQELWHEINREGRTLLAFNVRLAGSVVSYDLDENTKAIIRLCNLQQDEAPVDLSLKPEDNIAAETMSGGLSLLLSYAHRLNLHVRSQPGPPHIRQSRTGQPYSILRPIIAYLEHERSVEKAAQFMADLTAVLQSAGLESASFVLTEPPISVASPDSSRHASASEALLSAYLNPREFQIRLTVTPTACISVVGITQLSSYLSTSYSVRLLPPLPSAQEIPAAPESQPQHPPQNVLRFLFPPSEHYPNLREVRHYIRGAVARVIADRAEDLAFSIAAQRGLDSDERVDFVKSISGTALSGVEPNTREVRFEVCPRGSKDRSSEKEEADAEAFLDDGPPELRVYGVWPVPGGQGELARKKWTWTAEEAIGGVPNESLEAVYGSVLRGDAVP